MARLIGGHVSGAGGLPKALGRGDEIGANVIQVFSNSPRGWKASRISMDGFESVDDARVKMASKVEKVVSHASYLINLASPEDDLYSKSCALITETMTYASEVGISDVVLHVGSHRGTAFLDRLQQIVEAIDQASEKAPFTRLLLENSAGSGDCVGSNFDELGAIISRVEDKARIGVCLDTQHLFASGIGFETIEEIDDLVAILDVTLPVNALGLIHLNDSKVPFASRVDRHANLGEGQIGIAALASLLSHPRLSEVDVVLEVPGEKDGPRGIDVTLAREMLSSNFQNVSRAETK